MVTTKLMGGLGNQLFMIAATIGYSIKHDVTYQIPLKIENPHYEGQKPYVFPYVIYAGEQFNPESLPVYKEDGFHYQEIPYMKNLCLSGYWQSEKYFAHCKEQVLKAFGFEYKFDKGTVSIHIRRGDYLNLQHYHTVQSTKYFKEAIAFFNQKGYRIFKVFGNGMAWSKENINDAIFPGNQFVYVEGNNETMDLALASHCEHHIGSAGTFSVWVDILNQNPDKISTFPEPWFGPEGPKDTQDIYPANCIKIAN